MEKLYGVFKFTFDSRRWTAQNEKNWEVYYNYIMKEDHGFGITAESNGWYRGTDITTEDKNQALRWAQEKRYEAKEERSRARYGYSSYRDAIVVHECDEKGEWIASPAEIKRAIEWRLNGGEGLRNWETSPAIVIGEVKDEYVNVVDKLIAKLGLGDAE